MLRIYSVTLQVAADAARAAKKIQRWDPDLARQVRKAGTSVPLNTAEGMYSRAGNRIVRYEAAMASAREVMAALHTSEECEYLKVDPAVYNRINHVIGTFVNILR